MIEKLKDLEQEAMDNLDPETYSAIVSNVMEEYDQEVYQAGYIDGLQTAINMLAEQSETMSYSMDVEDIFPDDDEEEETAQEYPEIYDN
jgi:hypothetical protein